MTRSQETSGVVHSEENLKAADVTERVFALVGAASGLAEGAKVFRISKHQIRVEIGGQAFLLSVSERHARVRRAIAKAARP